MNFYPLFLHLHKFAAAIFQIAQVSANNTNDYAILRIAHKMESPYS